MKIEIVEQKDNTIKDTLVEAYLEGIDLKYSDLKKANLEGINFQMAYISL